MHKFYLGQRVRLKVYSGPGYDSVGTVVCLPSWDGGYIGVSWDGYNYGHTCDNGMAPYGSGWNADPSMLEPADKATVTLEDVNRAVRQALQDHDYQRACVEREREEMRVDIGSGTSTSRTQTLTPKMTRGQKLRRLTGLRVSRKK